MKKILLFCATLMTPFLVKAQQDWHIGGMVGISNYSGDLSEKRVDFKYTKPTIGIFVRKDINRYLTLRAGLQWGMVAAADSTAKSAAYRNRNLSFRSHIGEINLIGEFNFMDMEETGFTPYIFAGISGFAFNPEARLQGQWITLRNLGTEGQGLSQYPDRNPYNLFQFAIPFGVGAKYELNETWTVGLEFGLRYTFTDYLDDVSSTYVDQNTLLLYRGATAVEMAYRGDEVNPKNGTPGVYPPDGTVRGNPKNKDWYAFSGITIAYRLAGGGNSAQRRALRNTGCPNMRF
ncbi:outer membrane protein with beta-barrel domain [Chitinophaga skermanii]|uniref:Outer membrane protein with beta-barrel domain n=1 Tax=Chitinophaga skermanii TaxID=331697 RepID=A0A327Q1Y1_9BACT|nr:DUF6089 family protein [Chitinophaga skermanii]RAI97874.1 outer membrane protein with beta-barrel domain [Chitinophaga skermanii]